MINFRLSLGKVQVQTVHFVPEVAPGAEVAPGFWRATCRWWMAVQELHEKARTASQRGRRILWLAAQLPTPAASASESRSLSNYRRNNAATRTRILHTLGMDC